MNLTNSTYINNSNKNNSKNTDKIYIGLWLFGLAFLVFLMIILGGLTRLTESGLSMVDWNLFMGVIPPISISDWEEVFNKYQLYPEYQLVNKGMSLQDFKIIFWFEYSHRLLGRLIGLFFIFPYLYLLLTKKINLNLALLLLLIFLLGVFQAFLGWFMVRSGLADKPDVSHYRLAAHLSMAIIIYILLSWATLTEFLANNNKFIFSQIDKLLLVFLFWLLIVVVSGAFVAGTNAGLSYNTFPLMDGKYIPDGIFSLDPIYMNFFENLITIQFMHRTLAVITIFFSFIIWFLSFRTKSKKLHNRYNLLFLATILQVSIGIITLISVVPISLGLIHQMGAMILITITVFTLHGSVYSFDQKIN